MSNEPNRGTIAKNTRKTEDKHPDIAGTINVDGKDYWINGWQKKNRAERGAPVAGIQPRQGEPPD